MSVFHGLRSSKIILVRFVCVRLGTFCPEEAVMPQNITFNLDTGMTGEEQLSNLVVEDGGERPSWSHAWVAKALYLGATIRWGYQSTSRRNQRIGDWYLPFNMPPVNQVAAPTIYDDA